MEDIPDYYVTWVINMVLKLRLCSVVYRLKNKFARSTGST